MGDHRAARRLDRGRDHARARLRLSLNVILGLIGAVIGGWIFTRLGIPAWGFWASLAAATVGAVVLVAIGRLFAGGSSR
jgi:uncharacterized membrane protein YeaQ/YmgE (transglycosylase-associated protein family)